MVVALLPRPSVVRLLAREYELEAEELVAQDCHNELPNRPFPYLASTRRLFVVTL